MAVWWHIFLRCTGSGISVCVQSKRMKKEHYPFDNFSLGKFSTLTQKRAMSKEDLKQIISLPLALDSKLQVARDYFLFSYYGLSRISGPNWQ